MTEYEKVMAEAQRLEKIADELQSTVKTKLQTLQDRHLTNWRGESSIKFINEVDELSRQVLKEVVQIDTQVATIRKIAKIRKETAEKAAQLASSAGMGGSFSSGGGTGGGGGSGGRF